MTWQFPDRAEELAQEGWVALWLSTQKSPEKAHIEIFLKIVALNKMRSVIRGWVAQSRDARLTVPSGLPGTLEGDIWSAVSVELGDIEMAYHHGDIMTALGYLTPGERKYVVLKYWGGYTDTELRAFFGYRPCTLGEIAKKKLAKSLSHLELSNA